MKNKPYVTSKIVSRTATSNLINSVYRNMELTEDTMFGEAYTYARNVVYTLFLEVRDPMACASYFDKASGCIKADELCERIDNIKMSEKRSGTQKTILKGVLDILKKEIKLLPEYTGVVKTASLLDAVKNERNHILSLLWKAEHESDESLIEYYVKEISDIVKIQDFFKGSGENGEVKAKDVLDFLESMEDGWQEIEHLSQEIKKLCQ